MVALVEDDGSGFGAARPTTGGFGLIAMRERLQLLGGDLAVESTQGAGTTLQADDPAGRVCGTGYGKRLSRGSRS